ncbi:extracellular calcium-sensing receptor-like [Polypterus senegalus]|uniref:extracellular calcium-sensing receptor-like n=1 Tax=Polypterus senegalus TaxID=55291 RepID=UPI001963AF8B|nr:extracellular calcium-sensing receptor-like [Polypterus senegalus]
MALRPLRILMPFFSKGRPLTSPAIIVDQDNCMLAIGSEPVRTFPQEMLQEGIIYRMALNLMEFQFAQTMVFAIEEINNNTALLPDLSLGYKIYGDCSSVNLAMAAVMALVNDENEEIVSGSNCKKSSTIYALIGLSESPLSISVATFLSPFRIPMVSYFATCACLSNRNEYPTFFRTIPSDYHQSKALAKLVKQFGWTWIGVIRSDNDYGIYGTATFIEAVQMEGVCIEYTAAISRYNPLEQYHETVNIIKQSTSKVIVAFTSFIDLEILIQEIALQNITGLQWIGSEAWISNAKLTANEMYRILGGALGFAITNAVIPGLKEFLSNIHPSDTPANSVMDEFWENIFNYTFTSQNANDTNKLYEAAKQLSDINNQYTDVSDLRIAKNIYKGMYAIAHALHDMSICPTAERTQNECTDIWKTRPWQVLESLKKVNFTMMQGESIFFDGNGDTVAHYELLNWQINKEGVVQLVPVGIYDASLPEGQQLKIHNNSIIWGGTQKKVPRSVCSKSCTPGTFKAVQKGRPSCCYDCILCADGEISNTTDSIECLKCPEEYRSNEERDKCILKDVEFLTFGEIMGVILTVFTLLGTCLTVSVAFVFFCHRHTPIVRANNSELSFLLLFSLTLCFLCSLTFIGQPSDWSCMFRHTFFGITFVMCISCILAKTIVVLMAFNATRPGANVMKWFGPSQQRLSVFILTFIQVFLCMVWLTISPPFFSLNIKSYKHKIIFECDLGSTVAFYIMLGYIGVLSALCFVLSFLARKLPDNFNEAKFITFSMIIFCAVWLTFIPAYISSPGKYTVAVEIFAILASSFALLFCIFSPKCYIILLKPEQNTKKSVIGKK